MGWWSRFSIRSLLVLVGVASVGSFFFANWWKQEQAGPTEWDLATGQNIKWKVSLGTNTFSSPTAHGKYVFVGSNNGRGYDADYPASTDASVLICFDAETGEVQWQHTNEKLPQGRESDWPAQGVTSKAFCQGNRLWYVNNRGEIVCLDTAGFFDGVDDGLQQPSERHLKIKADVIWKFDMRRELNVFPHNISHSNVVVDDHRVYANTSNGVDPSHVKLGNPDAPSFVAVDKKTGKLIWSDNSPGDQINHGSWGSPTLATIHGKQQVIFGGGDGWLYSFEPAGDGHGNSKLIWKFDGNPKNSKWLLGGRGTRNSLLTAATIHQNRVYLTMGQDPEHGEGLSRIWCIDPGKRTGDISLQSVVDANDKPVTQRSNQGLLPGQKAISNPNSAVVWEYTGANGIPFCRSLGRVAIHDSCLFATDIAGFIHCVDLETGNQNWCQDIFASFWTTPLISGGNVYVGDEDGFVTVFPATGDHAIAFPSGKLTQMDMTSSIFANSVVKLGVLYVATRNQLIAIEKTEE